MKKPIREDFIERDEASDGTMFGSLNEDDYIDSLETYISYLETLKNLPNEPKTISNDEQEIKVCCTRNLHPYMLPVDECLICGRIHKH